MVTALWCWFALGALIVLLLTVDLFAHRGQREPTLGNAWIATGAWLGISIVFGVVLGVFGSWGSAGEYFGVYLTEKSLSVDNIFVFAILFKPLPSRLLISAESSFMESSERCCSAVSSSQLGRHLSSTSAGSGTSSALSCFSRVHEC